MAPDRKLSGPRRAAVIGAGWAGLAAAHVLAGRGYAVTVYEAAREVGGRARTVVARPGGPAFSAPLDNGQHLLLGAYTETLALMRELGQDPDALLLRAPLRLASADGRFALRAPRLPSPLHGVAALLGARGLSAGARWAALRFVLGLRAQGWLAAGRDPMPGQAGGSPTVARLLATWNQPREAVARLWRPLCLAALNTPPEQACARLFAAVLRDSLDAPRSHSDLLLPRCDLSSLWPRAAAARHQLRRGQAVRELVPGDERVLVDGEPYAAAVLAVPPGIAARLLPPHPAMQAVRQALRAFRHLPIATLTVRLAAPFRLAFPMLMLTEDAARGHLGQWVFDRRALLGHDEGHGELAVVVSAASDFEGRDRAACAAGLLDQLREQLAGQGAGGMPPVQDWELLVDKRATFAAVPDLARPGNATAWPRLALCGDWTDTGYPGTLEGAVRSGLEAGRLLADAADARG
ncbi:hydroxysqualene dehydroxylase HpnE [Pigmentiphaga daeguensis]|uniref:hydroxysqualene dehydroxylase HpnE n=1 Tax=Pigmentiphaga daeguensis TaxID=414049 RepID=UPI0031E10E57